MEPTLSTSTRLPVHANWRGGHVRMANVLFGKIPTYPSESSERSTMGLDLEAPHTREKIIAKKSFLKGKKLIRKTVSNRLDQLIPSN